MIYVTSILVVVSILLHLKNGLILLGLSEKGITNSYKRISLKVINELLSKDYEEDIQIEINKLKMFYLIQTIVSYAIFASFAYFIYHFIRNAS